MHTFMPAAMLFFELAKLCPPVGWIGQPIPFSGERTWQGEVLSVLRRLRSIDPALLQFYSSDVLRFIRRSGNPFIRKRAIELLQTFPKSAEYSQNVVEEAMRVLDELDLDLADIAYLLRTSFMQATGFRRIEYAAALASEDIWWMLSEVSSDSHGGSAFGIANLR